MWPHFRFCGAIGVEFTLVSVVASVSVKTRILVKTGCTQFPFPTLEKRNQVFYVIVCFRRLFVSCEVTMCIERVRVVTFCTKYLLFPAVGDALPSSEGRPLSYVPVKLQAPIPCFVCGIQEFEERAVSNRKLERL